MTGGSGSSEARAFVFDCGRPGHPPNYGHACAAQCASVSPRSRERCHKNDGHDEWHWIVREGDVEVWGLPLPSSRSEA